MKKKVLIIFLLLFCSSIKSQIQSNFFVEDAKGVDFVRFKLCVNNEAKIYSAEVIKSESTYSNQFVINQLKEYFLSIEFYSESKFKNDCFKTTSKLINSKYENIKPENIEISTDKFLKGKYKYKNPFYNKTIIKRNKRIQREIGKNKQIYFIKWLSKTKYILIYKRMTEKSLKKYIGKKINVEILGVLPDKKSYVYKSTAEHFDWVTYGVIQKVN